MHSTTMGDCDTDAATSRRGSVASSAADDSCSNSSNPGQAYDHDQNDAPLDFSMRKPSSASSHEDDSTPARREGRPGSHQHRPPIMRSPEIGQTAVHASAQQPAGGGGFTHSSPQSSKPALAEPITVKTEKIGEPQTGLPGLPPGTTIPASMAAMLPGMLPAGMTAMGLGMMPLLQGLHQHQQQQQDKQIQHQQLSTTGDMLHGSNSPTPQNGKSGARPFKAYPKDPLTLPLGYFGLPGQNPFPGMDAAQVQAALHSGGEEVFKQYKEFYLKHQAELKNSSSKSPSPPLMPGFAKHLKTSPAGGSVLVVAPTSTTPPVASPPSTSSSASSPNPAAGGGGASSPPSVSTTTPAPTPPKSSGGGSGGRKRTLPEELKDQAYWERRRKNNDAAKRSRDARRAKEDEIAIRAAFLEQENLKLRVEVSQLKNETQKLRCMLYNS